MSHKDDPELTDAINDILAGRVDASNLPVSDVIDLLKNHVLALGAIEELVSVMDEAISDGLCDLSPVYNSAITTPEILRKTIIKIHKESR